MTRQFRGTCGCGWRGVWCDKYFIATGEVNVHHERDDCDASGGVYVRPKPQQAGYDDNGELITDGGRDVVQRAISDAERFDLARDAIVTDGGPSVISVDGVESPVPRRYLHSCERAGAEVREE